MRTPPAGLLLAVLAVLGAAAPVVHAQSTGGDIDLDAFRPAIDSRGYVTVNASRTLGHKELSFGLVTDWGYRLLHLEGPAWTTSGYAAGNATYEVTHMVSPQLQAAYGLFGRFELGVGLPFRILSGKSSPSFVGDPADPRDDQAFRFSAQGLGDVGLHLKVRLFDAYHFPVGLALLGSVYIPGGYDAPSWLGENTVTPRFQLILDKEFRRFRVAANIGVLIRSGDHVFLDSPRSVQGIAVPVTNLRVSASSEIPFGAAIALAIAPQKFDLIGEVFGAININGASNYQPLEAVGAMKVYLGRNSFFLLGAGLGLAGTGSSPDFRAFMGIVFEPLVGDRDGDGIPDDVDQCPDEPEDFDGFEDEDGCPDPDNDHDGVPDTEDKCPNVPGPKENHGCPLTDRPDRDGDGIPDDIDKCPDEPEDFDGFQDEDGCPDLDNDGDGIPDTEDACPNEPEDMDGFQDEDGCPDPDNDNDRIPDAMDKCPNEQENYNGFEDDDGCPDKGRVIVHQSNIEILDKIYFETNKAIIKPESFPILDAIASTLQGNPDILEIEIQGHADERGSAEHNLKLTDDRAHSVMKYLTDKGVEASRLAAKGYGKEKPVDLGHNEEAWSKNRRVEFVIQKRVGQ